MRQQINLYQPVFRRERKVFSAVAMIQVLALLFVALLGVYAWQLVATHALQQQLQADQQRQGTARMQLSALILKLSSRKVSPALAQALSQAQQDLAGRRAVLQVLSSQAHGNIRGFSPVLSALSRSVHAGIWLTNVDLADGGTQFSLAGRITRGEILPRYLNLLRRQSAVSGYRFSTLEIIRDKKSGHLHFLLATLGMQGTAGKGQP